LSIIALGLSSAALQGQDIHFSQIGNSPMNLNPALAGVFGGDMRYVFNYRSQWRAVPVGYETLSASVENKFYFKKDKHDPQHVKTIYNKYVTGGLMLNHDRQGSLDLTSIQIGMPIALTLPVGRRIYMTGGILPKYGQRYFKTPGITVDYQWNGSQFDPSRPLNEPQLLDNTMIQYFDLGAGYNFRLQADNWRTYFDYGVGAFHINRPRHEFWTGQQDIRLDARYNTYFKGMLQISEAMDLYGQAVYQRQGRNQEIIYGLAGRLHLSRRKYNELAMLVGVNFRHLEEDAVAPYLEIYYRTWMLGFSYDANLSEFNQATNRRGGPELSLIYRLYRIKGLTYQSCSML
jgi:type IX secretion system PorP/SprF family membrane protein